MNSKQTSTGEKPRESGPEPHSRPPGGIGLILGAGGARGTFHAGLIERLQDEGIPIRWLIGASAGAIVSSFFAAGGLNPDQMMNIMETISSPELIRHGLLRRPLSNTENSPRPIPAAFRHLDEASFEELHFGVQALGIVAFDLRTRRLVLFKSGEDGRNPSVSQAVAASAAVPGLFGVQRISVGTRRFWLVDGGMLSPLPLRYAFSSPFEADRVLAVDILNRKISQRFVEKEMGLVPHEQRDRIRVLCPPLRGFGTILFRPSSLVELRKMGYECLDSEPLAWLREGIR